jgi:hypothetical protein
MTGLIRRLALLALALGMFVAALNGVALVAHVCPVVALVVAYVGIPAAVLAWDVVRRWAS